jgi:hypothetical protein
MRSMPSDSHRRPVPTGQRTRVEQSRLLKSGVAAHAFTRADRSRGGHPRAEKIRRRKELREQFDVAELEELTAAELELLDRALVRLNSLIGSDDDRVALRAVGRCSTANWAGQDSDMSTDARVGRTWTPRWLRRGRSSSLA